MIGNPMKKCIFAMQSTTKNDMSNILFAEEKTLKSGFIAKRIGYKWGLYDNEGNILMRPLYDYISINQEDRIWARFKGKLFFVKETKLPFSFDFIHDSDIEKEWYIIESDGYLGVADDQLNVIIPLQYKYIIDYGGILWCSNEHISTDTIKGVTSSYLNCTLFSYKAERLSNSTYKLYDSSSSYAHAHPIFPIIYNEDGYNLLDNYNKLVLSTPAKSIFNINDLYIIDFQTEKKLYNYKNNRFIDNYRYTDIKLWKWNSSILICKRSCENVCDVYVNEKLVASYNPFDYSIFDVADDFIIVCKRWYMLSSENMLPKYGFINNKGLAVPCIYDRITVHDGAISIVIAEVFEDTSKKYMNDAIYVEHHSSKIPDFYVSKGKYDVFAFDGHCICENNDIITTKVIWNIESDSFFIHRKEKSLIEQYNLTGFVKTIDKVLEAHWNVFNIRRFEIYLENGSTVFIPFPKYRGKTKCIQKPEQKKYSAVLIAKDLSNSDYCPIVHTNMLGHQSLNTSKKEQNNGDLVFHEGLSPVIKDGKWGFVDEMGEIIIPFEYDEAEPFSDGLAAVRKGNYFGYIDYNNNVIIDFKFVKVWPFANGLAKFDNNPMFEYVRAFYNPNITDEGYLSKDGFYIDYVFKQREYDYNYERPDYARDTWDAMTDGMYGDYPGSGIDYDTIGFGI